MTKTALWWVRLFIRSGEPKRALAALLAETGADAIFAQEEYAPHAIERDTESACVIGRDYPAPILDHGRARERAMEFFGNTRKAIKTY